MSDQDEQGGRFVHVFALDGAMYALTSDGRMYRRGNMFGHDQWVRFGAERLFDTDNEAFEYERIANTIVCPDCGREADRRQMGLKPPEHTARVCLACCRKAADA